MVLLLVMPLQGLATTLGVLACQGKAGAFTGETYDRGAPDPAVNQGASTDGKSSNGGLSSHFWCVQLATDVAEASVAAVIPEFPRSLVPASDFLDLFVPEQPHRPPLV